jgi:intron-binding protein aquarius
MDQSMFARFVRLGGPRIQLDQQGRARREIAALYSWRYRALQRGPSLSSSLRNLPFIDSFEGPYKYANPGFLHNFQLIDVGDFKGRGESCPTAHFYQNLGEAEYVVAVYMYMRLLGYPAEKISIITTYNGQKSLIRDIIAQRCKSPVFGHPAAITTVDKFQGQQNDYILLSLVRTEAVGHIRDVRRLVVALSRARLGLYVFCRRALFENCYELSPAFSLLSSRPSKLQLVVGEGFPTARPTPEVAPPEPEGTGAGDATRGGRKGSSSTAAPAEVKVHEVADVTEMGVLVYQMVQQAQNPLQ